VQKELAERKQVEESLHKSEAQFRLLAENATDIIWTVDLKMHLTYVSPSVTSPARRILLRKPWRTACKRLPALHLYEVAMRVWEMNCRVSKPGKPTFPARAFWNWS